MVSYRVHPINTLLAILSTVTMLACQGSDTPDSTAQRRVVLPVGEIHNGWYFAAGEEVSIEGTVNGDVYAAGGKVSISGTVNGDVIAAGGQVIVDGKVSDDIRVAGGSVEFGGTAGKNLTLAGGSVRITREGTSNGGLLAAGGDVVVDGRVNQHAVVASGTLQVNGSIGGNVSYAGGSIVVGSRGKIGGDVSARVRDPKHAEIAPGSVTGSVSIKVEEHRTERHILGMKPFLFTLKIFWMLSLIATALLLVWLIPEQVKAVGATMLTQPGRSALWGAIGFVGIPVLIIVAFITMVGVPVGLMVLALFFFLLYLSQMSLGVVLGQKLFKADGKSGWPLFGVIALGIAIVQILTFIPYIGLLLNLAGILFGLGAILVVMAGTLRRQAIS